MAALPYPPRTPLVRLPTPLERMDRLGHALGLELWLKRDDQTDIVLSGNKVRKLEHVLPEALAAEADTLIVGGGAQSNLCRVATLAAARLGLRTTLVLGAEDPARPPPIEGNLLLCHLAGAELRWVAFRDLLSGSQPIFERVAAELRERGARPFIVPLGSNGPLGTWGHVHTIEEIVAALPPGDPITLVYPVASGGTGAGLLLGIKLTGLAARAIGVLTTSAAEEGKTRDQMLGFVRSAAARQGLSIELRPEEIELVDGSGAGYSVHSPEELRLIAEVAREGLILDPTYNAKGFLTLGALARAGKLGPRVVYLHTGGIYGLFAYRDQLLAAIPPT